MRLNSKLFVQDMIRFLLIALFIYAGSSKLFEVGIFKAQMMKSPLLPASFIPFLAYAIPLFEIALSVLLASKNLYRMALLFSFFLMLLFSLYLIALNVFFSEADIPCSCGGILGHLTYEVHIIFNLCFTILSLVGFIFSKQGQPRIAKENAF